MTSFKLLMAIAPLAVLAACATAPVVPPPEAVLEITGKTCTAEPSTKDAVSLTPVKKQVMYSVSTLVDGTKPCVTVDNASRNYVVYVLPDHAENHTLTVGGVQEVLRTFAPSVSVLDADGKVTRTFADDRFALLGNMLGVQLRPTAKEKYILVQSNPALVGKSVKTFETRLVTTTGYAAATPYSYGGSYTQEHGTEGAHNRVFSHEGYVSVTIQAVAGKIGLPDEK